MTSLFWVIASLFLAQNSLFDCSGKLSERGRNTETTKQCGCRDGPSFANFPVFFPVSREFGAETGSQWTVSSASQYGSVPAVSRGSSGLPQNLREFRGLAAGWSVSTAGI